MNTHPARPHRRSSHLTLAHAAAALALLAASAAGLLLLAPVVDPPALPAPATVPPTPAPAIVPVDPPEPPPTARPTPTPAATPTPGEPLPTVAPGPTRTPLPLEPGDLNVLLLGCDDVSKDGTWRTDSIVVVAIRPQAGFAAMFSIPRDLWVEIPGYGMQRINTADYHGETTGWPGGGPGLVGDTLMHNFGIPVHAYVRVRIPGLIRIIDTLGGITVTVDRAIYSVSDGKIHFGPGVQHMDGATALRYARLRTGTNESDLGRTRRQQQVLLAIRDAALRPAMLLKLPQLVDALSDTVDTDLSVGEVLSLANLARRLGPESTRARTFDGTMVQDWVTPGGAMVLLPQREAIEAAWAELTAH